MIGQKETVEEELRSLDAHFEQYAIALNTEAVWLFLATLGCWSVSEVHIRVIAYGVAAYLFGERFISGLNEQRSFKSLIKTVRERIEGCDSQSDYAKARLHELSEIMKSKVSTFSALKRSKTFFMCWCFFAVSMGYALWELPRPN